MLSRNGATGRLGNDWDQGNKPASPEAEIERAMISQRTKQSLARKRSEGERLGRPKGSLAKTTKLMGKDVVINDLLEKQFPSVPLPGFLAYEAARFDSTPPTANAGMMGRRR